MNQYELRLQKLNYILANIKDFDNKEYIHKLKKERDNLLNKLIK